jgi:hypothetical protein
MRIGSQRRGSPCRGLGSAQSNAGPTNLCLSNKHGRARSGGLRSFAYRRVILSLKVHMALQRVAALLIVLTENRTWFPIRTEQ